MTDPSAFNNRTEISRPSRLSYPAFALPGSRAPGSRPLRSDLHQCHPAVRKPTESRCYPAASHVLENVTRQSRVPTVCPPAVERADCTLYASTRQSGNRCDPAASDVTRQSRVSTVCHPAVGKPSNSGPDCGLSKHYPAFAVGGPVSATSHRCYPAFVAWKSPGARGRPRAPEATPRSCAHAAPLRPSAWSGARRWGESCELSLSKI